EPQLKRLGRSARLVLTTTFADNSVALARAHSLKTCINILNPASGNNHAKIYLGRRGSRIAALVGPANLTGGLVSNLEAAVLLRGNLRDAPIKAAWDFAESLWAHQRCVAWSPGAVPLAQEEFTPPLTPWRSSAYDAPRTC